MDRFFPGCELDLQKIPHTNAVTLGLRTSKDVNFHAPVHTGYGLTQVLPIIVAALSSGPKGLLLIENPEVHLHPRGQAAMGEFLAEVATAGAQVIMETHSDHVLNGIRRAVKKGLVGRSCCFALLSATMAQRTGETSAGAQPDPGLRRQHRFVARRVL